MKIKFLFRAVLLAALSSAALGQAAPAKSPAASAKLPTAKDIVDRYVTASGGRDAIEKIRSRVVTGTVDMAPMGLKGTMESITAAPGSSVTKISLAGIGDLVEGYDGTTAWSVNPIQGNRTKSGAELLQAKIGNDFYRDIRMDKIYPKMTVTGMEKVGNKDAYVVKAEPVGLNPDILYFDAASGMLVRVDSELISPEGNQKAQIFYDEYKPYDGVMVPTKMRTVLPQLELTVTVTDVKHNTPVDAAKFAKPK